MSNHLTNPQNLKMYNTNYNTQCNNYKIKVRILFNYSNNNPLNPIQPQSRSLQDKSANYHKNKSIKH
jgi:hypothetical protein